MDAITHSIHPWAGLKAHGRTGASAGRDQKKILGRQRQGGCSKGPTQLCEV